MPEQFVDEDRVIDVDRLNRLLRQGHPDVEVVAVRELDASEGSASRVRLAVEYAPAADAGLPPTMFLKRNLARFGFPGEMYSTEVRLYRDVLPGLPIETPAIYAVESAPDDVRFTLLMEDLGARPGVRLGIVTEPTTPDEVASVLDTLVVLHAAYWGAGRLDRELPWLVRPTANPVMSFWREIGPRLAHSHLASGHRSRLVEAQRWPEDALWAAFDRLVVADDDDVHTLVHGDVHAGNVYYVAGRAGGLLDWQLALRGSWASDVSYLLVTALDPDDRIAHERDLLRHYLDGLAGAGVAAPTFDDAWLRYRQNALFGVLMWLITPDGVHSEAAQARSLERCLAAGERLGTLSALGVQ
ncbi:MAG TPA: phosphotransferase [Acidimicrobiales bacterium]|jgi:hypothetical protein|nr:phosphotransferase [Acidimicrobiales bacterium]